jgi:hypothetical protein
MMRRNLLFAVAIGLATVGSGGVAWSDDADQTALLKALPGAKVTLEQGIAQVAKGSEVPTEAKYEMEDGKLMLSIYTSPNGFTTAAEDNSFNEYGGDEPCRPGLRRRRCSPTSSTSLGRRSTTPCYR